MGGTPHEDTGPWSVYWPPKLKRADLKYDELLSTMWNMGVRAVWETRAPCPCGDQGDNSPRESCPVCHGKGFEFILPQEVRITAVGYSKDLDMFNRPVPMFEKGGVMLTFRGEHAPALWDRVTITDSRVTLSLTTQRAASGVDKLRYPIVAAEFKDADRQPYDVKIFQGRVADATGLGGAVKTEGVDFTVTPEGNIDWAIGEVDPLHVTAPARGTRYSIVFKTRPVYRVMRFPHAIRDTRTQWKSVDEEPQILPVQAYCELEWDAKDLP